MEFNYSNAVNVFTDASNLPAIKGRKTNIICPAYVVTINGSMIEYGSKLIKNATASYGELFALAMGIQAGLKYANTKLPINIFSDSEISVSGCTVWLPKWYKNGEGNYYLTKKDNHPAANQEIILDIIQMVCKSNTKINIMNILGHISNKSVRDMDRFTRYFFRANDIPFDSVPIGQLQQMAHFNDVVDNISRTALRNIADPNHPIVCRKQKQPNVYWYPKEEDIQHYASLVNN